MSISFSASKTSLLQLGVGAGDIAILAGAGRAVITFLTARFRDAALFQYLDVDPDTLITRKGIIDKIELEERWGKEVKLFLDGKRRKYSYQTPAQLEKFSWVLTLITAALHVSLSEADFKDVLTDFVLELFDHPSQEHLRHELDMHIGGWKSMATVHKIVDAAQDSWDLLGRNQSHPIGWIPKSDSPEILAFLKWLTKKPEKEEHKHFTTTSSDVYSLALVLHNIGIPDLRTRQEHGQLELDYEDRHFYVILTTSATKSLANKKVLARKGIPIPLSRPEEIIRFWPIDEAERFSSSDALQDLFIAGMNASVGLTFSLEIDTNIPYVCTEDSPTEPDLYYVVSSTVAETKFQLHGPLLAVAQAFFPVMIEETRVILLQIQKQSNWHPKDRSNNLEHKICQNRMFHGMLQSFVMGYYYSALLALVDWTQMSTREAFGSWGWWDYEVLQVVSTLKHHGPRSNAYTKQADTGSWLCWRYTLIKVVAYFFAGATAQSLERLDARSTGIVAKLCLLTSSMLGAATCKSEAAKFHLLDIDDTCIPNRQGVVVAGRRTLGVRRDITPNMVQTLDHRTQLFGSLEDYKAHVEPDWSNDRQTSLICFRHNGRVVHRISPLECDIAMVLCYMEQDPYNQIVKPLPTVNAKFFLEGVDEEQPEQMCIVDLKNFFGGELVTRGDGPVWANTPILIPTRGLPKARTCLIAMYLGVQAWRGHSARRPYQLPAPLKGSYVLNDDQMRPIVFS